MSVINQMLKDLDQRQAEQNTQNGTQNSVVVRTSSKKLVLSIVAIFIVINIIGIFLWQLYTENQKLKTINHQVSTSKLGSPTTEKNNPASVSEVTSNNIVNNLDHNINNEQQSQSTTPPLSEGETSQVVKKTIANVPVAQASAIEKINDTNEEKMLSADSQSEVYVNEYGEALSNVQNDINNDGGTILENETEQSVVEPSKSSLTISRKQLSPNELAQQKINQAEQAVANNLLAKAEMLFEEVLLIVPENNVARKQLAALWFGKKSYQAALNLLSQGIARDPLDSEYRLMKARIYLEQRQTLSAVNVLKVLSNEPDVEYQSLLAASAQQTKEFEIAIKAYQLLAQLQPNVGRWWLGLAIVLDSSGDFEQAIKAYISASEKTDLSESARQFARQRSQELGE